MTDKITLRSQLRAARRAFVAGLDQGARDVLHAQLADRVFPHLPHEGVVASYWPVGSEIDPQPLDARARSASLLVAHPLAHGSKPLTFHIDAEDAFVTGLHGIPQPSGMTPPVLPDLVLVPLLGADETCNRLGQGAGYYDRTLAELRARKPIRAIGLAYDVQIVPELPIDPWDAPLDAIATPTRLIVAPR